MIASQAMNRARPGAQWTFTNEDFSTLEWGGPGEPPTLAELEAAWAEIEAERQAAQRLAQARADMAALFDSMTDEQQAAFFAVRTSAEAALDRGKIGVARAMVECTQVTPELEPLKAQILALFP